jgi:predicted transcriptional regulator
MEQLTAKELAALRAMRRQELKTYEEIAEAVGVNERTIHRILTITAYHPSDLIVLQIRQGLNALDEKLEKAPARTGTRG